MRVLLVFNDYAEAGGERFSVATEAAALVAAGLKVEQFRVSNDDLVHSGLFGKARAVLSNGDVERELRATITAFQPDIVHAENLFPRIGSALPRVLLELGIPWVRTLRNYRKGCLPGSFVLGGETCRQCAGSAIKWSGVKNACYRGSRVQSAAAAVQIGRDSRAEQRFPPSSYISVSRYVAEQLEADLLPDVPRHVVNNAVAHLRETDPRRSRRYAACFAGRLHATKGVDLFLDVAASLPELRFAVAGVGEAVGDVVEAAARLGNIDYMGDLMPAGVAEMMSCSTLTLVPSQWDEPFGRVAVEAMAVGSLPLVAFRGGLAEIVVGAPYDAALPPDAAAGEWAARIKTLTESSGVEELREWAVEQWRCRFSTTALADSLISIYRQAVPGC